MDRAEIPILDGLLFFNDDREYTSRTLPLAADFEPPRHVIVCGLGRGGTTAAAGILLQLGLTTPDPNPFLESISLRQFRKRGDVSGALAAIRQWDAGAGRIFWKEPKLKSSCLFP